MSLFGGGDTEVEMRMPEWLRPAGYSYGDLLSREIGSIAGGTGQNAMPFFPGQTYAGMSPLTSMGMQHYLGPMASAAGQSSNYFADVMGGQYLGMNPQFQNAVMNPAIENVASRFASAGRYGSPASQSQMAEAGMRALAPYYDAERQRMGQAAMMGPQINQQYGQGLFGLGQIQEGYDQQGINEAMQRHYYNPNINYLQQISGLFSPGTGFGSQNTNTGGMTLPGILGGAMMGGSMGAAHPLLGAGAGSVLGPAGWAGIGLGGLLGGLMA